MKKENIIKIGNEKGVKNLNLFVNFLTERFPEESDRITTYFEEWADRFNTDHPESYMDKGTLQIYNKIKFKGIKE